MSGFTGVKRRVCLLFACLLLAAWAPSASAGVGVYWSFVNHTAQDLRLRLVADPAEGRCWNTTGFPEDPVVPAGLTSTFYFETNCVNTELVVRVLNGPYEGELAKIWTREQARDRFRVTRNIASAQIRKFMASADVFIGTSNSDMNTSLRLTGEGWADTVLAGVGFAARHVAPPPGSYLKTCNADYYATEGSLHTDCEGPDGAMVYDARMHYTSVCAQGSQVSNLRGYPVCDNVAAGVPAGSYLDTCSVADFDPASGVLQADCGGDLSSKAALRSVNVWYDCAAGSTLSNQHGSLVCDRPFTAPSGSYLSACREASYDGHTLSATCRSFIALGRLSLDYAARCAPWSEVRLDSSTNQLACDTPRTEPAPAPR